MRVDIHRVDTQLLVGGLQLGGALRHPSLQLLPEPALRFLVPLPLADVPRDAHDLDEADAGVLDLGAQRLTGGGETFRVFADPSGHPFCLFELD